MSVEVAETELSCSVRVYGSSGCNCDIDTDCSVYGDSSYEKCCGTGQGFCGEYSGDGWIDICHSSDILRLPPGCSIELATESGGGGYTYKIIKKDSQIIKKGFATFQTRQKRRKVT